MGGDLRATRLTRLKTVPFPLAADSQVYYPLYFRPFPTCRNRQNSLVSTIFRFCVSGWNNLAKNDVLVGFTEMRVFGCEGQRVQYTADVMPSCPVSSPFPK